ncbi:hypothetical protein MSPP1_002842 [Malassezia sp. CBS 17886]|nr:hypothetical protein MSPP1_002842 [Malassezia sp. CBS 17886]
MASAMPATPPDTVRVSASVPEAADGAAHHTHAAAPAQHGLPKARQTPPAPTPPATPPHAGLGPAYFYPVDAFAADGDDDARERDGIPVFTPTMAQFEDFYAFCQAIDAWGMKYGIVKVVPPREWVDALPSLRTRNAEAGEARLDNVRIRNAITQHFLSAGPGRWKQTNITRTAKTWDAKQWADTCRDPQQAGPSMVRVRQKADAAVAAERASAQSRSYSAHPDTARGVRGDAGITRARPAHSRAAAVRGGAKQAARKATSAEEWDAFDHENGWTQEAAGDADGAAPALHPDDWNPVVCRAIEHEYWRSLNLGKPPMYGADLQGTLFDARTRAWNVGQLDNLLTRSQHLALPGVTTPYLYFGMWRASFAWHVEDMDLYSINYIHFGAPKQWYAIRQSERRRFESVMAAAFPADSRKCSHFMRHKSFLASPSFLASQGVRPLRLVQHAQEFVLTFPHGYHAGYNLGFNCAESVNFALPTWVDIGRRADFCKCEQAQESVHFDVDVLLGTRKEDATAEDADAAAPRPPQKRRRAAPPARADGAALPYLSCVFCPMDSKDPLVDVAAPACDALATSASSRASFHAVAVDRYVRAHTLCACFIPETWVAGEGKTRAVHGADCIDRGRWSLKCQLCTTAAHARHGAKVQCTRGKCARAVHIGCALEQGSGWFLDFCDEATADRLEGVGRGSHVRLPTDAVAAAAGPPPPCEPQDRIVVLCRAHNPRAAEQAARERRAQLRAKVDALVVGQPIYVKNGSGTWVGHVAGVDTESGTVRIVEGRGAERGDGGDAAPEDEVHDVPWARIAWEMRELREPAPRPASRVDDAFVLECKVPTARRRRADENAVEQSA